MRILIQMFVLLLLSKLTFGQTLHLNPQFIHDYQVLSIKVDNHNLFLDSDGVYEHEGQKTELEFDKQGFLVSSSKSYVYKKDTLSMTRTIYIYHEDSIFMSLTKEFVCGDYRHINVFKPDSTCLPNISFKLYDIQRHEFKLYESDDDLNFYLNYIFFDRSTMHDGMQLYLREMKWLSGVQSVHHLDSSSAEALLNELFISYSYTGNPYEIEDEHGNIITDYSREWYNYDESSFTEKLYFEPSDIKPMEIKRENFSLTANKQRKINRKIQETNAILLDFHEYYLKIYFAEK